MYSVVQRPYAITFPRQLFIYDITTLTGTNTQTNILSLRSLPWYENKNAYTSTLNTENTILNTDLCFTVFI